MRVCWNCRKKFREPGNNEVNVCPYCGTSQEVTADLVHAAAAKDQDAMTQLYMMTQGVVYTTIHGIISNEHDTEDLLQDTYITVFTKLDSLENASSFYGWIQTTARRKALTHVQKNKRSIPFSQLEGEDDDRDFDIPDESFEIPDIPMEQEEVRELVNEMVIDLKDDIRIPLVMFYYDNVSVRGIAEELGVTESTVKNRLFYGRRQLKVRAEEMEKRGYSLRGLAPVPFLTVLLKNMEINDSAAVPDAETLSAIFSAAGGVNPAAAGSGTASFEAQNVSDPMASGSQVSSGATSSMPQNGTGSIASGAPASSGTVSAVSQVTAAAGTVTKGVAGKVMLSLQAKILAGVIATAAVAGGGYAAVQQFSQPQTVPQEELPEENMETAGEIAAELPEAESSQEDQENTVDIEDLEASADIEEEASEDTLTDNEEEGSEGSEQDESVESWSVDGMVAGIMYAASGMNVRSGPSIAYEVIGTLSSGAEMEVTGQADTGWYRILFQGEDGYVSDQYLTAEKPAAASETETTASAGNETSQAAQETDTAKEQTTESASQETAQTTSEVQQTETTTSNSYQSQVVSLTNAQRTANGVAQLAENSLLMSAAQTRAEELASIDSIYVNGQHHTRLDGRSWATAMDDVGYSYTSAAENLAQGQTTPEQAVTEWMNSQGHKTNILNSAYTETGVGYAVSASGTAYWVQLFAAP